MLIIVEQSARPIASMKPYLVAFFLASVFFAPSPVSGQTYRDLYPRKVDVALAHALENETAYQTIFDEYNCSSSFLISLVLPEVSNYNEYKDLVELKALEVFYTELGAEYSDFSVGLFQMKPSFIESLEKSVRENEFLEDFHRITQYSTNNPIEIRAERIDRIRQLEWRTRYLCCFYCLVNEKFRHIAFESEEEKLAFFAMVYNRGIEASEEEIRRWMQIPYFPNRGTQGDFSYSSVALEFYKILSTYDRI